MKFEDLKRLPREWRYINQHSKEQIIRDTFRSVCTRTSLQHAVNFSFISQIVPKNMNDALEDEYWIQFMQKKLSQFTRNEIWELVPRSDGVMIIRTKCVFRKKEDEEGKVVKNKSKVVA